MKKTLYLSICSLLALAGITGACSTRAQAPGSGSNAAAAVAGVALSSQDLFGADLKMPAAERTAAFAKISHLPIAAYFDKMLALETSAVVTVDGKNLPSAKQFLIDNQEFFTKVLPQRYPTVGALWSGLRMNPETMTYQQFAQATGLASMSSAMQLTDYSYIPVNEDKKVCSDGNQTLEAFGASAKMLTETMNQDGHVNDADFTHLNDRYFGRGLILWSQHDNLRQVQGKPGVNFPGLRMDYFSQCVQAVIKPTDLDNSAETSSESGG